MAFDWNNLVDNASNIISDALPSGSSPNNPPTSTPAPMAGSGVVQVGQPQSGGSVLRASNTMLYVGIGIAALVVVVILVKR